LKIEFLEFFQFTYHFLSEAKAGLIQEAFLNTGDNISYRPDADRPVVNSLLAMPLVDFE
jgi:hypothetical protein